MERLIAEVSAALPTTHLQQYAKVVADKGFEKSGPERRDIIRAAIAERSAAHKRGEN